LYGRRNSALLLWPGALPVVKLVQDQWSDSNIRFSGQRALLRMLESKDHRKIQISGDVWNLTFAFDVLAAGAADLKVGTR
jgi:hypothetical protein